MNPDDYYTQSDVAEWSGLGLATISRLTNSGALPARRMGTGHNTRYEISGRDVLTNERIHALLDRRRIDTDRQAVDRRERAARELFEWQRAEAGRVQREHGLTFERLPTAAWARPDEPSDGES